MDCSYPIPHDSYTEGVSYWGSGASISSAGGSVGFAAVPGSLGLPSSVPFTRADSITVSIPQAEGYMASRSFSVSVLGYSDVDAPIGLYTGLVDSSCMDGLAIEDAEGLGLVLSYSPPAPPQIVYDIEIPGRPDLNLIELTIPGNTTDVGIIAVLPDLFSTLEAAATAIIEDVLGNLSTAALEDLNDKIFSQSTGIALTLRGISAPSARNMDIVAARAKASLSRDLLILSRKGNNSTAGVSLLAGLETIKSETHALHQTARLDNAKLNVSIALQSNILAVLLYNAEVQNAHVQYLEYSKITDIEVKKLDLFQKELSVSGSAMDGNSDLAAAYRKQLSVVKQVFESFEQAMKLSEYAIKLATMEIDVETQNIKTSSMLAGGSADNAQNRAYQAQTAASATGLNTDAAISTKRANIAVERGVIARDLLSADKTVKNSLIDSENGTLDALAGSVATRIQSIQTMFDLENLRHYNDTYLHRLSSGERADARTIEQDGRADGLRDTATGKANAENAKVSITAARRNALNGKLDGFNRYLSSTEEAFILLHEAQTKQTLNHTISSQS